MFYGQESKLREKIALGEFLESYPRFLLEALGFTMIIFFTGRQHKINYPILEQILDLFRKKFLSCSIVRFIYPGFGT